MTTNDKQCGCSVFDFFTFSELPCPNKAEWCHDDYDKPVCEEHKQLVSFFKPDGWYRLSEDITGTDLRSELTKAWIEFSVGIDKHTKGDS